MAENMAKIRNNDTSSYLLYFIKLNEVVFDYPDSVCRINGIFFILLDFFKFDCPKYSKFEHFSCNESSQTKNIVC